MNGIVGLLRMNLPDHTVRMCDGGFIEFEGVNYTAKDSYLGSLVSVGAMSEGMGTSLPVLDLSFNPPSGSSITLLSVAAMQKSEVRLWVGEYDESGIVGTPELRFLGFVDQPQIKATRSEFQVSFSVVPNAEWLFERDTGNALSASFQKFLYAGDTGHDQATGLGVEAAWGIAGVPQSGGAMTGGGGYLGTTMNAR